MLVRIRFDVLLEFLVKVGRMRWVVDFAFEVGRLSLKSLRSRSNLTRRKKYLNGAIPCLALEPCPLSQADLPQLKTPFLGGRFLLNDFRLFGLDACA